MKNKLKNYLFSLIIVFFTTSHSQSFDIKAPSVIPEII